MHMMFVDESGDPGYPGDNNWAKWGGSCMFARVGLIIHGWKWRFWNSKLLEFKKTRGLLWDQEIKASDIRWGKHAFAGWDEKRRGQFFVDLLQLIGGNLDISLIGVVIDKKNVDTSRKERLVKPEVRSLELLLEAYNLFLNSQQKDKFGIVVMDPVKEQSDDNIRYFQSFLMARSERLSPLRIVEGAFFAKSHTSNLIQIADLCTNVFYREMVKGNNSQEYQAIQKRFWRFKGRLNGCGISKWP